MQSRLKMSLRRLTVHYSAAGIIIRLACLNVPFCGICIAQQSRVLIAESLILDKFNYGSRSVSISLVEDDKEGLNELMRGDAYNYNELALDYLAAGLKEEAVRKFQMLVDYGGQHQDDMVTMDYFAVSLSDLAIRDESLDAKNCVHCLFMQALGMLGLSKRVEAKRFLSLTTALDNSHVVIAVVRCLLNNEIL